MADTAKRLAGPAALTGSAATKYTVPASTTTILRSIHVANGSASMDAFTISIGADAAGTRLFDAVPIDPNDAFDWTGFIVMTATEIIQAWGTWTTSAPVLTISGVEVA